MRWAKTTPKQDVWRCIQYILMVLGMSQAQAFVDGNKRTALIVGDVFLRLNGWVFRGDPLETARRIEAVATREGPVEEATAEFIDWLRGKVIMA